MAPGGITRHAGFASRGSVVVQLSATGVPTKRLAVFSRSLTFIPRAGDLPSTVMRLSRCGWLLSALTLAARARPIVLRVINLKRIIRWSSERGTGLHVVGSMQAGCLTILLTRGIRLDTVGTSIREGVLGRGDNHSLTSCLRLLLHRKVGGTDAGLGK